MGNWTLGRVGLDVVADSADAPATWTVSGDEVEFSGVLRASNASDARFLRLQLNGLVDNVDEPVVPFYWSEDASEWDGYYRVADASVGTVPLSLTAHWFPFTVKMVRVADGFQAPMIESRLLGALRVNAHSITTANTIAWWSPGASVYAVGRTVDGNLDVLTGAEGDVFVYRDSSETAFDVSDTWYVAPTDYYDGSVRVELTGDAGTTYRAVIGRQIINLPQYWRLSNSLMRITSGATANEAEFSVSWYDGTQWETAKTFRLQTGPSGFADLDVPPVRVTILRNSPECCAIRVHYGKNDASPVYAVDYTLRRGSRYLEVFWPGMGTDDPGLALTSAEALTAITGGARATNNDAGGNKLVLAGTTAVTLDTTNGKIRCDNADPAVFMIGCAIGGTVGSGYGETQGIVYQWMAAVNEKQGLVQA